MRVPFMREVAWYLVFAMFIIGIAPKVEAGFVASEAIALSQVDRAADIENIQKTIETKMIKERLEQLGFTQDEINSRLSQLTDQQIHQIALQLDELKVGGDGLDIIIALLVIAILVIVVLQLTGHKVTVTK
ncbi:MAG: PA2779 family protein [Thermodesulfovibrionales bacterium]|nr:PA2779 family protein [Thermodesulfovibrionales bacterium]